MQHPTKPTLASADSPGARSYNAGHDAEQAGRYVLAAALYRAAGIQAGGGTAQKLAFERAGICDTRALEERQRAAR